MIVLVHLDTSFLVDALTGSKRSGPRLKSLTAEGIVVRIGAPVVYEWLRGPRTSTQLSDYSQLFPPEKIVPVDNAVAGKAAALYKTVRAPRGREMDILIAACALEQNAALATLNREDFEDIPGLVLMDEPR